MPADVFISYASRDRDRVIALEDALRRCGISVWRDQSEIAGGENYGPRIVSGIRDARVLLICCTDAALRSKNVKQEIQLAWRYDVPYLPVLLEAISYPDQIGYWLEGWQWIEIHDRRQEVWLPLLMKALQKLGVTCTVPSSSEPAAPGRPESSSAQPPGAQHPFEALWSLARLTDQIWPLTSKQTRSRRGLRDLGAPQDAFQRQFALGTEVLLAIEWDRPAHLTLLDRGTSGTIYCLCPSAFAPDTSLAPGLNHLPQDGSPFPAFPVTGTTGQEHLLALVTQDPLFPEWQTRIPGIPARRLSGDDISSLLDRLRRLPDGSWSALASYFDIVDTA